MADAPSPYAPGIVSDERSPPRAPGRPVVFLVATFVMTAVGAGFSHLSYARPEASFDYERTFFGVLRNAPSLLTLVFAYLSDRVPLGGSRREGYVLLAALMAAAVWVGIAAAGEREVAWYVAAAVIGLAGALSRGAIAGALAEVGQRRAATGWLAAANISLMHAADIVIRPAMTPLADISAWAAAGVAAGLALALVILVVTLSDEDAPLPAAAPVTSVTIPRFLGSRAFWALVPVLVCMGAAAIPESAVGLLRAQTNRDPDTSTWLMHRSIDAAVVIAVTVGYALLCRRMPFRKLLRLVLFLKVLQLLACGRMLVPGPTFEPALLLNAGGDGLITVAVLDLALRAAPRGREAFGTIFIAGVCLVAGSVTRILETPFLQSIGKSALIGAGAAIVGAVAASLLPREIDVKST